MNYFEAVIIVISYMGVSKIREIIERRIEVENILPKQEKAEERLSKGGLKIYWGIDPTGPSVHLGHTIALLFLKELTDLVSHDIIILIGDFTARIGDPTGKLSARENLTKEEIERNEETYIEQISKILPRDRFDVKYNSEWLAKMPIQRFLESAANLTVQQVLTRDMFRERIKEGKEILLNEFLYPLMQGYDSVHLAVDAEVGGNEQLYNMKIGRELEKKLLGKDKLVLPVKILTDPATGKKMSKTEGNMIAINDSPQEIRRKILAWSDDAVADVFKLCTEKTLDWIREQETLVKNGERNPRDLKEELADELVKMFHGTGAVAKAREAVKISETGELDKVLKNSSLASSSGEAKRLIEQGAVQVNGEVVKDWHHKIKSGDKIQVGKGKFIEVK